MTPDGIATEDWDRVHELALEVVNFSAHEHMTASHDASVRLIELLDDLQEKYGPLPSLLATRADYLDNFEDREYWLLAAYGEAGARGDSKNLVLIAESLASLYLQSLRWSDAAEWVARLERHLEVFPNRYEAGEAARMRGLLTSREDEIAEQCFADDGGSAAGNLIGKAGSARPR